MICVSLAERGLDACLAALKGIPFAEIRLDMAGLALKEVRKLFSGHANLIATCRPGRLGEARRRSLLVAAIESGAAYVDIEFDAPPSYRKEIVARARDAGCSIIVSFHDYGKTPERKVLEKVIRASFRMGADIVKIACMVRDEADNSRLLRLLDGSKKIVVVGMGEAGRVTRVAAPLSGSPFTFASLPKGRQTADGQIDHETLKEIFRVVAPRKAGLP